MAVQGVPRATRATRVALRKLVTRDPATRSLLTAGIVQFSLLRDAQLERTEATLGRFPTLNDAAERVLQIRGAEAVRKIKTIWPIDTGLTKELWALEGRGLRYVIFNPIDYVQYVHKKGSTTVLVGPGGEVTRIVEEARRKINADLVSLFRLALAKIAESRAASAQAVSAGQTPAPSIFSRIRRFFGG